MSQSAKELQQQLKQSADKQAVLLDIAQRIADNGPLGSLLDNLAAIILRGLNANGVRIVIRERSAPVAFVAGELGKALASADEAILKMTEPGDLAMPNAKANGTNATKAVVEPLRAHDTLHGGLCVVFRVPTASKKATQADVSSDKAQDIDRQFLKIIAAQTAVAIANAQAFAEARQGREQLAAILTSSVDPILVIDPQERIKLFNPAAEHAFGVSAESVIGKRFEEVIDAEPLVAVLKGGAESAELIEWQNAQGQTFQPRVSEMGMTSDMTSGRVLVLRDITRYKTLRDNQSEFVSTVSHDLRSPLTFMSGYVDMLPMIGEMNEKQHSFAEKISTGITQMTDLVDKILDASRLDPEGYYRLNREPCDVTKIVNEVVSMHVGPAERKGLTLLEEIDSTVPILNLDELMVRRALNNLTDNAIKYTPVGGHIWVRALVRNNNIVLEVQDDGLGINEENQKHMFERFRRVRRREHQGVKGSGLGLYIVKRVAEHHGGSAQIESAEGKGSKFILTIPMSGANLLGSGKG